MKKVVLFLMSVLVGKAMSAQSNAVKLYIETYREIAINEMIRTGVPAAITLAQGILESQAGQSQLCQQSNNHFGIKCKDEWTGPYVLHDDDKKNECFRVYPSGEASFKDHSDFLKNRPYYTDLFTLAPDDYKAWAVGLKKDGYATERNYPQMLVKIIEDNNLQQYTITAIARMKDPVQPDNNTKGDIAVSGSTTDAKPAIKEDDNTNNQVNAQAASMQEDNHGTGGDNNESVENIAIDTDAYPDGVFTINETKVIYAKEGSSLLALASVYNVSYKSLLDFNELPNADILAKSRLIYLEKKPKRGSKDFHVVTSAETIEEIAQKEGVRLESLLEYNSLQKGSQPAAGTKVYLRAVQGIAASRAHKA